MPTQQQQHQSDEARSAISGEGGQGEGEGEGGSARVGKMPASEVQTRHRDKSRELANAHKDDDDPNKVSERIRLAQERVRDRLRPLLTQTITSSPGTPGAVTSPTSPSGTGGAGRQDLRLDLTNTGMGADLNASMLSTTWGGGGGTQRFNASDKARELAEQRLRSIRENSYRTVVTDFAAKRSATRFDQDNDDDDEFEKTTDARSKFKRVGVLVAEVGFIVLVASIHHLHIIR